MRGSGPISVAAFLLLYLPALVAQREGASPKEYSFTVSGSKTWTDAGVDLAAGDRLTIAAETSAGAGKNCSPEGTGSEASRNDPLPSATEGALLARISEQGSAILIGRGREMTADSAGRLWMGLNQQTPSDCAVLVKVKVAGAENGNPKTAERGHVKQQLSSAAKVWLQGQFGASSSAQAPAASANTGKSAAPATSAAAAPALASLVLDPDLRKHLDELPRRVHDHAGNLGDMVNLALIGSEERVKAALDAADWHLADVDSKEAGLKAIVDTYQRKDYLEMPMSHLYLFDRMQDFGYEQAQAYAVVASRHHFRLWKAPFTSGGETVWVGAATHDIGFEKDVRTGHLTHKIDPDVDGERENLATSVKNSGKVKAMGYYLPSNPVLEAKNASGGTYHSDGRLLVVILK